MLQKINVISELERCGIKFIFAGSEEIKVHCPFHDDGSESCNINIEKRVFSCQAAGCKASGDIITFLARVLKTDRYVVYHDLAERYSFTEDKTVSPTVVEKFHEAIRDAKPMIKELHKRGITDAMIRKYRLGYDGGRIQIPIYNAAGSCVNIRKYLPGAPGKEKMRNLRGHGDIRLYPIEQIKYEKIVIAGGEMKAVAIAERMNIYDIGSISTTAGEGSWDLSFTQLFKDKDVFICFDVDQGGIDAVGIVAAQLSGVASCVKVITLPLDVDKYPHGDANDYFGVEKKTAEDFLELINSAKVWEPKTKVLFTDDEKPADVNLHECTIAGNVTKRLRVKGIVTMLDTNPFIIPKSVKCSCERNHTLCHICNLFPRKNNDIVNISSESPGIIDMVDAGKNGQRDAIKIGVGVPADCKSATFEPVDYFNVEDARLSPQLDISIRSIEDINQPVLYVGKGMELNENYEITGRVFPHPKTQQSVFLCSNAIPVSDALSTYSPDKTALQELRIFQSKNIQEKLNDIYTDIEANITNIYQRQELHLAIDLAFHSPLVITLDGREEKGWVEILIIGDSAQGKTEASTRLMKHYGLGERIECKNASRAGLLGGLKQVGQRFFVSWGVIPSHDKRLVILEELKGASVELIGSLTDMRSTGIAEIPKIEKRRTHARTRLIAISNPRSNRGLDTYNFGMEAIQELIGGLEDIRRFDYCITLSAKDVNADALNELQRHRPKIEHKYRAELCRRLILWSWTRSPQQVKFTERAREVILDEAIRLCKIFVDTIPIIDRGSIRFKIARLAASLAARLFSTDETLENLIITPDHVRFISAMLEKQYSSASFGYRDFSDAIRMTQTIVDADAIKAKLLQAPFPADLIRNILHSGKMDFRDIQDWSGMDSGDASALISVLVRKRALYREGHSYRKSAEFVQLLKEIIIKEDLPDFVERGEM